MLKLNQYIQFVSVCKQSSCFFRVSSDSLEYLYIRK